MLSRLMTDKRLRVLKKGTDQPLWDVWAIGDASVMDGPDVLPATAQVAAQQANVRLWYTRIPSYPLLFVELALLP
jgi:NADH dehydrogenase FAD-containing subunit